MRRSDPLRAALLFWLLGFLVLLAGYTSHLPLAWYRVLYMPGAKLIADEVAPLYNSIAFANDVRVKALSAAREAVQRRAR